MVSSRNFSSSHFVNYLFLDDIRQPEDVALYHPEPAIKDTYTNRKWQIVRSYESFTQHIIRHPFPDCISFDHDLGSDENGELFLSGYDCAKWLIDFILERRLELPMVLCHSLNPVGRANIEGLFKSYKKYMA